MLESALIAPVGLSASDTVLDILGPISRLLYNNTCILSVTTFVCAGLLTSFVVIGFTQFIQRLRKERKSDD